MERIAIVTFHRADNYGAVLQGLATQEYLQSRGLKPEILDYRCPAMEKSYQLFKIHNGKSALQKIKIAAHDVFRILRRVRFERFRRRYLHLSDQFGPDTVAGSNKVFDTFIVGSDQVWNDVCSLKDSVYVLEFVEDEKKKLSYSASFGYDHVEPEREAFYREALARFNGISVREPSGSRIVKSLVGIDPVLLPDPTLMIDKETWNQVAVFPEEEKYILVYLLNARDDILQFAKRLSEKTGLPILNITDENRNSIHAKCIHNAGPSEFLGLMSNAEYTVTNSFHGLMFSLIYRKSVYVDVPKGKSTTYERITNILDMLGINDRYIHDLPDDFVPTVLEYKDVEPKIRQLRESTDRYFDQYLAK